MSESDRDPVAQILDTAAAAWPDEDPETRVALADRDAEAILDELGIEQAGDDTRRYEAARAHVRLTLQEATLFGEPTLPLEAGGDLDTGDLEAVNAERRESIEAGVSDLAAGRAKRHALARDLGGEPRDDPRYLG